MLASLRKSVPVLRRFSLHPALRDLGLVGSSSFIAAIAAMLVISIVGKALGPALLGEYLLIRRVSSWLQAGVQVPSGVALPRFVAATGDNPKSPGFSYFVSALLAACGIALSLCFLLLGGREQISHIFFGSSELRHLVIPLGVLLLGLAVHGAVFGYLQGILRMGLAGALQVCNLGIVPILCLLTLRWNHSIPFFVNAMGALMIAGACLFIVPVLPRDGWVLSAQSLKKHALELFTYGLPRLLGDFGLQALLSLPAIIAAHYFPIGMVASLLLAGSFLAAVAAATLPLGIILLSRVSRSIAQTGASQLQTRVSYFVSALIVLSVFIGLQMLLFVDVIVRSWVGPSFLQSVRIIQITILAVPFYFVYAGLRGVIDGAAIQAYNARNIYIGLGAFLTSFAIIKLFMPSPYLLGGLAAAGAVGMMVLAVCTVFTARRLFEMNMDWAGLLPGLAIGVLLAGFSLLLHNIFGSQAGLIALVLYEGALLVVYFLLLALINAPWVLFLRSAMLTYAGPKQEVGS